MYSYLLGDFQTEELKGNLKNNQLYYYLSQIYQEFAFILFLQMCWHSRLYKMPNLKMKPEHLTNSDSQLNSNTLRTKNCEKIL